MKNFLAMLPVILMMGGVLAMCSIGAYGMVLSERRSRKRDAQMDKDLAESEKRMREMHDTMMADAKRDRDRKEELHAAMMKHIEAHGPRKQPWEEG